eukprot:6189594-Pleurochrysis_carterae.AAC.1
MHPGPVLIGNAALQVTCTDITGSLVAHDTLGCVCRMMSDHNSIELSHAGLYVRRSALRSCRLRCARSKLAALNSRTPAAAS